MPDIESVCIATFSGDVILCNTIKEEVNNNKIYMYITGVLTRGATRCGATRRGATSGTTRV